PAVVPAKLLARAGVARMNRAQVRIVRSMAVSGGCSGGCATGPGARCKPNRSRLQGLVRAPHRPDIQPCRGTVPWQHPFLEVNAMATGWAGDGAVQDQIDATVKDGIKRARSQLRQGPGLTHCEECDAPIPEARRQAVPGVRLCVACQEQRDAEEAADSGYNRRGSKDSQLR